MKQFICFNFILEFRFSQYFKNTTIIFCKGGKYLEVASKNYFSEAFKSMTSQKMIITPEISSSEETIDDDSTTTGLVLKLTTYIKTYKI